MSGSAGAPGLGRAVLLYSGLRFALLAGTTAVLLLAGVSLLPALVAGLLASAIGSLVLLRRQRDELAAGLLARRERSLARRAHEQQARDHVARVRRAEGPPSGA